MLVSSRAGSIETTSSPARSCMPRTPAASRPIGRTSVSAKRMAMPMPGDHEDVVVAAGGDHADQLVAVAQVDGDEPLPAGLVVLGEGGLLDLPGLGGEQQVPVGRELPGVDQGLDPLVAPRAGAG